MQTASDSRQYYLGIGGQQTGPYSEEDIREKVRSRALPADTLVWYEGLPDWQPLNTIEYFKSAAPAEAPSQSPPAPAPQASERLNSTPDFDESPPEKPVKKRKAEGGSSFVKERPFEPVFSAEEGNFGNEQAPKNRKAILIGVVGAVVVLLFVVVLWQMKMSASEEGAEADIPASKKVGTGSRDSRGMQFREAVSHLLIEPQKTIDTLSALIRMKPDDAVSKEAVAAVVNYYKQTKKNSEAGRFLVNAKRYSEAAEFFLADPPQYNEAEAALYSAYSEKADPHRKEFLLKDIGILISPLTNLPLATERIHLFEKEFPGEPHPYGYYLKSTDEKISDLFNRISFYFVQHLMTYINSEMPQINLTKRPLIEIKKDKKDFYRVVGSYKGDILLNQDKLPDIFFVFWLIREQWVIVDTNLTAERQKFAKADKERHREDGLSGIAMLDYLQAVFKVQFPKHSLHESVTGDEKKKNTIE